MPFNITIRPVARRSSSYSKDLTMPIISVFIFSLVDSEVNYNIGYLHLTSKSVENAGAMPWPLDIQYYSIPYEIFPTQIQSKSLLLFV